MPKDPAYARDVLNLSLRGEPYSPPATYWIALLSSSASATSHGTEIPPTPWSNYSRIGVPADSDHWHEAATPAAGSPTAIWNLEPIEWPTAVVTFGQSQSIFGFNIFDAAVGGNRIYYGSLAPAINILNGMNLLIPEGLLIIRET